MIILNMEQGSKEWHDAHIGMPSASEFDKILTTKGELSTQRTKLLYRLAGEMIIGAREETYSSKAMDRGSEMEPEARDFFQLTTGLNVEKVGFCHTEDRLAGCSPDGLIEDDEGLEIKCPSMPVHIDYIISGKLPTAYFQQVQGSLFVTGRKRWHFFSYYPRMRPLHIVVERDEMWIARLSKALKDFGKELQEIYKELKGE